MSSPIAQSHLSIEGVEDGKRQHMLLSSPRSRSTGSSQSSPPTSPDSPKGSGVQLLPPRYRPISALTDHKSLPLTVERDGGFVTQLIPADELPYDLVGVPRVQSAAGTWVVAKRRRDEPYTMAPQYNSRGHASTSRAMTTTSVPLDMQNRIDEIISTTPVRRPKIYCDKWIHEGVCAFTQQGCRYKHEMPLDRATQQSLGLLGLPQWYKNQQAVELRAPVANERSTAENLSRAVGRVASVPLSPLLGIGSSTWRREGIFGEKDRSCLGFGRIEERPAHRFGPIAPPSSRESSTNGLANPFAMLSRFDSGDEGEEK